MGALPAQVHVAMMLLSALGILMPRLWPILLMNAAVFAVGYVLASPVASNKPTMAFFLSLVVVFALLGTRDAPRERRFEEIAAVGRWLLPVMYFYGIYHKINADFLDPEVSCAVVLYAALFEGSALADWRVGHWGRSGPPS